MLLINMKYLKVTFLKLICKYDQFLLFLLEPKNILPIHFVVYGLI